MIKALALTRADAAVIAARALEFVPDVRIVDCSGTEPGFWVCFDERTTMNAAELADVYVLPRKVIASLRAHGVIVDADFE